MIEKLNAEVIAQLDAIEEKINSPALSRDYQENGNVIQFSAIKKYDNELQVISESIKGETGIMTNIRKRVNGLYEARLSFKGRYFSVYSRKLEQLKIKLNQKIKQLKKEYKDEKTLAKTKNERITVEQWYREWLEQDKKPFLKPKTIEIIENCFNNHVFEKDKGIGNVKLSELNKTIIQRFLNGMGKSRIKEITTGYLKSCITQAVKERLIEYNPFDTVKVEKKIKSNKVGFTADEQILILESIEDKDFYKIILFYLCLGCRRNELLSITKEDIKNGYVHINGTKTSNAVRYVNISKEFESLLSSNIEVLSKYPFAYITKKFKRLIEKLSLQGSIHSLRHSFITNHFYLGTPAKQVQSWVGHSTINLTLDIYTNLNPTIDAKVEKEAIKNLYNNNYYYSE